MAPIQEHPIGVDIECPKCGSLTIATHPFEHCWKCGNREWPEQQDTGSTTPEPGFEYVFGRKEGES